MNAIISAYRPRADGSAHERIHPSSVRVSRSTCSSSIACKWIAGGLLCGAWFAWRGTASRAWRPMAAGPLIVAAGLGMLAISPTCPIAVASTALVGVGVVIFTAHVFPTYILLAPASMISRFQSLLILVQQAPQLLINPLIGLLVTATGTGPMLVASSIFEMLASVVVPSDRTLRTFTTDSPATDDIF